jgi:hypothetical protein
MDKDEVKVVKVVVEGGVIQDIELPPGVKVIVHDYDTEGADEDCDHLSQDDNGDEYIETVWE